MSVLEGILLMEAVVLVAAAIFGVVGMVIARTDPDDPITVFTRTFWRWFVYPPMESPRSAIDAKLAKRPKRVGEADDDADEPEEAGDPVYGRLPKGRDGAVHNANLNVIVMPHAVNDLVLGREGDETMQVQVTVAAEEGAANKAVIQLVADALNVKPYQVTLTKGHYHSRKVVQIAGMDQRQLEKRLGTLPET